MNFIIRFYPNTAITCSGVESFPSTCYSDIAGLGNYEIIQLLRRKRLLLTFFFAYSSDFIRVIDYHHLFNFIISVYSYTTSAYICIDSFTTTYGSDIADYSNYEIHSYLMNFIIPV